MKNLEKYLLYITLIAVAGLYILHFTSNTSSDESSSETSLDTLKSATKGSKTGRIYFVNTDSVWEKYDYVIEITEMLNGKKEQFESQLDKEVRTFEREVTEFREKGMTMTEMEVQIKQRDLVRRESEISKLGEELEVRFLTEEKEWNDKLRARIIGYIDDKTDDRPYDYVLGYSVSSNIILANDSLDLTNEIINGLNDAYEIEKSEK